MGRPFPYHINQEAIVPTVILALALVFAGLGIKFIAPARPRATRLPEGLRDLARLLEASWPDQLAALRASGVPLNAYNNVISRTDAGSLVPEDVSKAMLTNLAERAQGSAVIKQFRRVPVARAQTRFPVLSALPIAYWVNGDTGLKQTTETNWANKFLNIEELACIVPIPDSVLDDTDTPIWDQVQPLCEEAAAELIDGTVYFGTAFGQGAPATFPTNVVAGAIAAGNVVTRGAVTAAAGGLAGDHSALLGTLEDDGYDATNGVAARRFRGYARQARSSQGERLDEVTVTKDVVEIDGVQYTFPMRGQWPAGTGAASAIAFDATEFVVGVRQDISWKLLDQAVITDNSTPPQIIYNLPQQDMVAMRMTMRLGWQVANTINRDQPTEANRYPAAVLREA